MNKFVQSGIAGALDGLRDEQEEESNMEHETDSRDQDFDVIDTND